MEILAAIAFLQKCLSEIFPTTPCTDKRPPRIGLRWHSSCSSWSNVSRLGASVTNIIWEQSSGSERQALRTIHRSICTLDYRVGSPRGGQMAHQSSSEPVPGSLFPLGLPLWGWCDRHGQTCLYIMTVGMRQHPGSPMPCSCDGIIVPLLSTVSIRNDWSEIRGYWRWQYSCVMYHCWHGSDPMLLSFALGSHTIVTKYWAVYMFCHCIMTCWHW